MEKKAEEIRNRIVKSPDLIISRVPITVLNEFKDYANAEFSDDYGMCLKYIWDYFKGMVITYNDTIETRLIGLEGQIAELKSQLNKTQEEDKKKPIKTLNGRIIR